MGRLTDKVALITGAAGGIGESIAHLFAEEGAAVVVADYNAAGGQAVAGRITDSGGRAAAVHVDVSQAESVAAMIQETKRAFGRLDILINNAGIGSTPAALHETHESDWDRVVDVDLKGVFLCMKYALPLMIEGNGGAIVNIASIAGIIGAPGLAPYAAAKAGVIELTRVVAAEYSRFNIRCNTIAPGWTKTAMVDAYIDAGATEQALIRGTLVRRLGEASEVAATALFLAGDEARFIQGTTIVIDGGITAV